MDLKFKFLLFKIYHSENKAASQRVIKILARHISIKGLISRIYQEFLQHSDKKTKNNVWAKYLNRNITKQGIWKDNKQMKRFSTVIFREMKNKTTHTLTRMLKIKDWQFPLLDVKLLHFWWEYKIIQWLWKTVL